ncbi:LuxR C-terminal-related transcriptional regulator [Cryobacterium psychrophilum]|uniref:GAF domain-containing protein n=1 Tax=Cryobacterium psychrophilum TaxID=41988 RepID=A0A4Y8KT04_9MICO|nr:LuxR C-terminal-related transcriptional regulator [Cryobacterium psychrophilum]TDW28676.1 GAF domain-containing protein [Cryobacterium psychrophilum]TFD82336.1 GAF domain-containing protein [Cryobacterium psychrophilum]
MSECEPQVYRPCDRELLKGALRELAGQSGIGVIFAGLVDRSQLTITEFVGTTTHGLRNLVVQTGEGIGGRALLQARPVGVSDYFNSDRITHQHDRAVRIEGLRAMVALPVLVGGQPRSMLYAATRDSASIGERSIDLLTAGASLISRELLIRDEVDNRVSILRVVDQHATEPLDRDLIEIVRIAHAELLSMARLTTDPALSLRLLAVTQQLVGSSSVPADAPRLTPRESDVLAQVALGCSYAEVGRRLALRPVTVKGYMQTIMSKLHAHSRTEAVQVARRLRLLP